jgi:hypothetical protein
MADASWLCGACKAKNAPIRDRCLRCKASRPAILEEVAAAAAASAAASAPAAVDSWREALDPASRQMYYVNMATGETSWARPAALGAAPLASGWFGVGSVSGGGAQAALLARNARWCARPARKQAEVDTSRLQRAEGANEYNIWWGRFIGDGWRGGMGREPAPTRCDPERDAGWTKATAAALGERSYFCIHFARGGCCKGADCTFHHVVPTAEDDGALDAAKDVFGRERHASHREDMGGVGSMLSNCRTLYVGGLRRPSALPPVAPAAGGGGGGAALPALRHGAALPPPPPAVMAAWEAEVTSHFDTWGELESVNVVARLAVAFVRYRCRANAEFALQAMANQGMGKGEVLNVRWAYDDPNPVMAEARVRADLAAVEAAMQARGIVVGPAERPAPAPAPEHAPAGSGGGGGSGGEGEGAAAAWRAEPSAEPSAAAAPEGRAEGSERWGESFSSYAAGGGAPAAGQKRQREPPPAPPPPTG